MTLIDLNPPILDEPDWRRLFSRKADREAAIEHWRQITTDMRSRDILAAVNGHAVMRLVLARVMHDRAAAKAMRGGPVSEPKAGNPRAIPRPNLYFAAMREAGAMAAQLEADLGLSPRTRDKVTKVAVRKPAGAASSRYLKSSVTRLPPPAHPLPISTSTANDKEPSND